jgi:ferredoxin
MVFINTDSCNGCVECVGVCPNGAIILQNHHAFIDQELCQDCEICVDSCPQGAILAGEPVPVGSQIIKIPATAPAEIVAVPKESSYAPLRNAVLPAIGSAILWTGREIVPRLANLAMDYLDRQLLSPKPDLNDQTIQMRNRRLSGQRSSMPGKGRRRRKRQHRKMYK